MYGQGPAPTDAGGRYSPNTRLSDKTMVVPPHVLNSVWPVLLVLLYVLATTVLRVLGSYMSYSTRVHDLVLDSKQRRQKYDQMAKEARQRS